MDKFQTVTPKRTIDNHITAKKALLIEGFFYFPLRRFKKGI